MCYLHPASVWLCKVHFPIPLVTLAEGLAGTGRNAGERERASEREREGERAMGQTSAMHISTLLTRVHFYLLPSPHVPKTSDAPRGKWLFIETAERRWGENKNPPVKWQWREWIKGKAGEIVKCDPEESNLAISLIHLDKIQKWSLFSSFFLFRRITRSVVCLDKDTAVRPICCCSMFL